MALTSFSLTLVSFDWRRVEGTGKAWDARRTEYWRSHNNNTISGVDELVRAARRTWEELAESRDISSERSSFEMKESPARRNGSVTEDSFTETPSVDSRRCEYHVPSRATDVD